MATITSSGVGSGLDVEGLVTKLMTIERQPLTQLDTKEASYQTKLTAFGTLKGTFASLQTAARALKSTTLFGSMTATSSETSVATASANTAATAGTYAIDVVKLAKGQTIASQDFSSMNGALGYADGQLKIELGTFADGAFTRDASKAAVTIKIPQNKSSLSDVRDAINGANAGVNARIIDVGGGKYKLMVTSDATGVKTSIRMTALDGNGDALAADNTGLARLNFDPAATEGAGKEFQSTVDAQDAHFKINNLDIYRSSNTVSDAITGVTLTLAKEDSTKITVTKNTSAVSSALDTFVKAYNAAATQVKEMSAYDTSGKKAAVLTGDAGVRALQSLLRQVVALSVTTESSSVRNLSDLGITLQRDGQLDFNTATLDNVLKNNPEAAAQLVTKGYGSSLGLGTTMTSMLDEALKEDGGVVASRTDGIDRSLKDINKRREALARRLESVEKRYRAQFSALDVSLSNMQRTSQYLQQQLSSASGSN